VPESTPEDVPEGTSGALLGLEPDPEDALQLGLQHAGDVGHSDPVTTSGYDRRGLRTRRDAVARLDLPL
jgi:hypothetical protein